MLASVHAVNRAVARMSGASNFYPNVAGEIRFEQVDGEPLGDVTVRVVMSGLTPGVHGFHVHQFGDVRATADLSTMSAHFVPFCIPPGIDINTGLPLPSACEDDQRHGIPPSAERQPGDMGNILVAADGTVDVTVVLGQAKMSLTDGLRSIVGRVVVVHSAADDGSQPYGKAGVPEAYGVIGLAKPPPSDLNNNALAPQVPKVTKVICTFEQPPAADPSESVTAPVGTGLTVTGSVLLTLQEPKQPGVVRMQAILQGMVASGAHSFHFHEWGDMTADPTVAGALGPIYEANAIAVSSLTINAQGIGYVDIDFTSPTLLQHVGRSLTIHSGPTSASSTLAAAACGLANPHAELATPARPVPKVQIAFMSNGSAAMLALALLFFVIVGGTGLLYRMRKPIPFCGKVERGARAARPCARLMPAPSPSLSPTAHPHPRSGSTRTSPSRRAMLRGRRWRPRPTRSSCGWRRSERSGVEFV